MKKIDGTALSELSDRCGIGRHYLDYKKDFTSIHPESRLAVLGSMGFELNDSAARAALAALEREDDAQPLPGCVVSRGAEPLAFAIKLPPDEQGRDLVIRIEQEDGQQQRYVIPADPRGESMQSGKPVRRSISLPHATPCGYHRLQLLNTADTVLASCALLVAPSSCFEPAALHAGKRVFGISLQLYTVRSRRNWGMGDFTDLEELIREAAGQGADVLGLNPLHALFPANPLHFSPYSPSSRAFLNLMYIDVEALADFADCKEAQLLVADVAFQDRLAALRASDHVDYAGVAECKLRVLDLLFDSFRRRHLVAATDHARDYLQFVADKGEALRLHATYDALHEHFLRKDRDLWGWPVWPLAFRNPENPEVARFAVEHAERIACYQYLQWCAHRQLQKAQAFAIECGMAVGIYLDLAVGVDQGGSEAWTNQPLFCFQASAGAPPDALAREGQDWGFPPFFPRALRADSYSLFVRNLRENMALAGAVRFDHAVSLLRLWWVPRGRSSAGGAYVDYPLDDLLGVLALESTRNECLLIGEDLGTVPVELTETMQRNHAYSYRVLYFEKANGAMIAPPDYPREALATVSTHDLPTLISWWEATDIELRARLNLYPDAATAAAVRKERHRDRQCLLDALRAAGYWQGVAAAAEMPAMDASLSEAVHAFLAGSNASMMIVQIEDLMSMHEPVNVPGTFLEYRNWQRKLRYPLEGLFQRPELIRICRIVREARVQATPSDAR